VGIVLRFTVGGKRPRVRTSSASKSRSQPVAPAPYLSSGRGVHTATLKGVSLVYSCAIFGHQALGILGQPLIPPLLGGTVQWPSGSGRR